MRMQHLSRNALRWRPALALVLAASALGWGCASGREQEVQRLQARAAYEQGLRHLQDKRLSLGIVALREAIALDPDNGLYRNALGVVYLDMRQVAEAQQEFERAVAADPTYAEAQHNLGLAHAEQGRFTEAIAQYRKAIAQPTYATPEIAYHNMGIAYLNLGRMGEAEEAFRAALRLDGKLVGSHFGLGTVLSRTGRMEEARAAFRTARDLDPRSPFGQAAAEALRALGDGG
jgi:type IV pilus assembly protein PilF